MVDGHVVFCTDLEIGLDEAVECLGDAAVGRVFEGDDAVSCVAFFDGGENVGDGGLVGVHDAISEAF